MAYWKGHNLSWGGRVLVDASSDEKQAESSNFAWPNVSYAYGKIMNNLIIY